MAALHVPEEVIEDILSRVPAKSLVRFKAASKKWYSLLSQDYKFAKFHLKQSRNHHLVFFKVACAGGTIFQSLNLDTNTSRRFKFPVEIECQLIGSANGLICIAAFRKWCCFIWNPCTGECKKISVPTPRVSDRVFGFGYDSCLDDYKIVANWDSSFRIFSLKTNSWKILDYSYLMSHYAFHLNGALHWCLNEEIAAFDLAKEVFSYIELPDEIKVINIRHGHPLSVSMWEHQGLLCLAGVGQTIWVMKKYGDGKSWVTFSAFLAMQFQKPLGISTLGEVVYQTEGGSGFVKSDVQGRIYCDKLQIYRASKPGFVYTESLISPKCFDGLNPLPEKMIKRPRKQRKTAAT